MKTTDIFDLRMIEASKKVRKKMLEELPDPDSCKHEFSNDFQSSIESLIHTQSNKRKTKRLIYVAALLVVIISSIIAKYSLAPGEKGTFNMPSFFISSDGENSENSLPAILDYYPDWLPSDYNLIREDSISGRWEKVYSNTRDEEIVLEYSVGNCILYDNAASDSIHVKIGNNDGLLFSLDDDITGITWYDLDKDITFFVSGNENSDNIIKIAENIKNK